MGNIFNTEHIYNPSKNINLSSKSQTKRIIWIDWMKAIGIYFIVLGHFFSIGHKYVYVFNVPLFFVISGFLSKIEDSQHVFWKKMVFNLIIPMTIICGIIFGYDCIISSFHNVFHFINVLNFGVGLILGMHSSLKVCWFIYTLCIIKILYQYSRKDSILFTLFILCLFSAFLFNHLNLNDILLHNSPNSIVNVLTAYPFFYIGVFLRRHTDVLNMIKKKVTLLLIFVTSLFLMIVSGYYNDFVWMWKCNYGNSIILFLLGGMAGTAAIFSFSKFINYNSKIINLISLGTILILGFHYKIVSVLNRIIKIPQEYDPLFALLIVLLFIPIIIICKKYFPLLLGLYRVNKSNC